MRRVYQSILQEHLANYRQMALVVGPRQSGKTTVCRSLEPLPAVLAWDDLEQRRVILAGAAAVVGHAGADAHRRLPAAEWEARWRHGPFPEPFLRSDDGFTRRWREARRRDLDPAERGFAVAPWPRRLAGACTPKVYAWDWSGIAKPGARLA